MKRILFLSLLLSVALGSTAMADLVDEFDVAHDFLTSGVAGTGWSGIRNSGVATVLNANITTAGALRMTSTGDWNGNTTTGTFLYKEVTGDFVAEIQVDAELYACGGLIVRLGNTAAGGAGEDNIFVAHWPHNNWNVGNILWLTNNGSRVETNNTGYNSGVIDQYLRVERQGANFYLSHSPDGVNWVMFPAGNPYVREDMNVATLQVGLAQTYGSWSGGDDVDFESFNLAETPVALSGSASVDEEGETSTTITVDLTGPAHTAPVTVVLTEVTVGDANDLLLNGLDKPLTLTFGIGETQKTFSVKSIDDELQEGPEAVKIAAVVSSTDSYYAGHPDTTWIIVNVTDNDQGTLVIDQGDGLLVDEDGSLSDSFTVKLSLPLAAVGTVTVGITTDGQVVVSPTQLTFTDTDWNVPQPVTVTGADDADLETDPHTGSISFSIASADLAYAGEIIVPGISADIQENECGAWGYSVYDYNEDCVVNLIDLAELASQWTQCTLPYAEGCIDQR